MTRRDVLFLLDPEVRGGAEEYVLRVSAMLRGQGRAVAVAIPPSTSANSLSGDLTRVGVKVGTIKPVGFVRPGKWGALGAVARQAKSVLGVLRRHRQSLVCINLPFPDATPGFLLACLARRSTLLVFHLCPATGRMGRGRRLIYRLSARRHQWVAVSGSTRDHVARYVGVNPASIVVVPNGVKLRARLDVTARGRVLSELGLTAASRLCLSVARLVPQKGLDLLINAMSDSGIPPSVILVVAGEGHERPRLEALVAERGLQSRVFLLGHREDVDDLLDAADIFLLPSVLEGAPFALLEALASRTPAVVSPEAIAGGLATPGVEVLTAPRSSAAWAAAIAQLLGDARLAASLAENGAALIAKSYDVRVTDLDLTKVIDSF